MSESPDCFKGCASEEQECRELFRRARRRHRFKPKGLGADKGSFHQGFIEQLLEQRIQLHIAVELRGRTSTHSRVRMRQRDVGYRLSQRCRKKIEELFGEAKDWHGLRRFRRSRLYRVREETWLIGWVLNLKRLAKLIRPTPAIVQGDSCAGWDNDPSSIMNNESNTAPDSAKYWYLSAGLLGDCAAYSLETSSSWATLPT